MKRYEVITMIGLSILLVLSCGACKKNAHAFRSDKESDLVPTLNSACASLGWKFQAERVATAVEATAPQGGRPLTRVILSNPSLTMDTSKLQTITAGLTFKDKTVNISMKEMVLRYHAKNQFLQLISCTGLSLNWPYAVVSYKGEKPAHKALALSVAKTSFAGYDLSPLLKNNNRDVLDALTGLVALNASLNTDSENIAIKYQYPDEEQKMVTISANVQRLQASQRMDAEVFFWLYSTGTKSQLPDFNKLSMQGKGVYDDHVSASGIKAEILKERLLMVAGTFAQVSLGYYLRPSECKSYFDYGIQTDVSGVKLFSTVYPFLEKLGDISTLGANLSFINLTPDFTQACYEMINKKETLERTEGKEEANKYEIAMALKIFNELVKSEPKCKFTIAPFKTSMCDLRIDGSFSFSEMSLPVGKVLFKVNGWPALLDVVKSDPMYKTEFVNTIFNALAEGMVINPEGTGTITIEAKEDFPGQFFFNGKAIRK